MYCDKSFILGADVPMQCVNICQILAAFFGLVALLRVSWRRRGRFAILRDGTANVRSLRLKQPLHSRKSMLGSDEIWAPSACLADPDSVRKIIRKERFSMSFPTLQNLDRTGCISMQK